MPNNNVLLQMKHRLLASWASMGARPDFIAFNLKPQYSECDRQNYNDLLGIFNRAYANGVT